MVITKETEEGMVKKMNTVLEITLKEQKVARTDPKLMVMMATKAWVKTVMDIKSKIQAQTVTIIVVTMAAFSTLLKTKWTHQLARIIQHQSQK